MKLSSLLFLLYLALALSHAYLVHTHSELSIEAVALLNQSDPQYTAFAHTVDWIAQGAVDEVLEEATERIRSEWSHSCCLLRIVASARQERVMTVSGLAMDLALSFLFLHTECCFLVLNICMQLFLEHQQLCMSESLPQSLQLPVERVRI